MKLDFYPMGSLLQSAYPTHKRTRNEFRQLLPTIEAFGFDNLSDDGGRGFDLHGSVLGDGLEGIRDNLIFYLHGLSLELIESVNL